MNPADRKKDIAVVGISGVFPKSKDAGAFFENLVNGKELIHFYNADELDPELSKIPNYVPAQSFVSSAGSFDYKFFGYTREEASIMDPQVRVMHEQVYAALDNAGYTSKLGENSIGLYLSSSDNLNWRLFELLHSDPKVPKFVSQKLSNKEFISTLISYKLGLTGPSFFIDSACSSSLSNIHIASRALLLNECTIAVAGGVCIHSGDTKGYVYEKGLIFSEDGHCRAFDENSSGTVDGEGAGAVVLKRYADAIRDNDYIYAVIKGTAVNNDGKRKVGYTAPSVKGQSDCIKMAMKVASVKPEDISYIEAHGTGTRLGDPIEIEALNEAFNYNTTHKCAIGSVKTNMGHLDAAAGIASFIKTCLILQRRIIPPSLNYKQQNSEINFHKGPFYVNHKTQTWTDTKSFIAGISSFGIGGTNCHVVLEEHPLPKATPSQNQFELILLSAKSESALANYKLKIAGYLEQNSVISIEQLSYSINKNVQEFPFKDFVIVEKNKELRNEFQQESIHIPIASKKSNVVFMFPGQGTHYFKMGHDLYLQIPFFKNIVDEGLEILNGLYNTDLKKILGYDDDAGDLTLIDNTLYTQPLLFLIEYALAKTLMQCGIKPDGVIGHSLGEYVAACIANVFSFEEALKIIHKRSTLISQLPGGSMIAVNADEEKVRSLAGDKLSVAAVNIPNTVVFSGEDTLIESAAEKLKEEGIQHTILRTSHAFHSYMMENILEEFEKTMASITFKDPEIALVSNLTGTFITKNQMTPAYWSKHLRSAVLFNKGLEQLKEKWSPEDNLYIEVGPGRVLSNFLKMIVPKLKLTVSMLRSIKEEKNDAKHFLHALGTLWKAGQKVNTSLFYPESLQRVQIPSYAFDTTQLPARVDPLKFLQKGIIQNMDFNSLIGQSNTAAFIENEAQEVKASVKSDESYRISLTKPYVAPSSSVHEKVGAIWESYLGLEKIGIEDDFFELGGDSLKAMTILNTVNKDFSCEISIQELYDSPTIKNMSDRIELTEKLKKVSTQVAHKNKIKI